ncbi:hypothetical protein ABPG72_000365 [Tetrahymena utriculariae]
MKNSSLILLICVLVCSTQALLPKNYLKGESDIAQCFGDIEKSVGDLKQIAEELKKLEFKTALQELGDLMKVLDKVIERCADATCWMKAQQRCENETEGACEESGLIWYPKCKKGYHADGCCVCVQDCPSGFADQGFECAKPSSYGRGAGYPWEFGDDLSLNEATKRCEHDNPQLGCEQWGLVIYPKCQPNFHNFDCCICSPNCPAGMTDIGVSCQKETYGRGVGFVDGKCIEENWNNYTPIEKFGKCVQQAEQIVKDIEDLVKSVEDKSDMWNTLKLAYVLLQHTNPFLEHCVDPLVHNTSSN